MDKPGCTEDEPLYLDFRAVAFLFRVADEAGKVLDAILNQKPIAEQARQLAVDLSELEMNMQACHGPETYWSYAEALVAGGITHAVFLRDSTDYFVGVDLWKKTSEEDEKKSGHSSQSKTI